MLPYPGGYVSSNVGVVTEIEFVRWSVLLGAGALAPSEDEG
jgi:hypothetical protein